MNLMDGQQQLRRDRLIAELRRKKDAGDSVLAAMARVPRHLLMPRAFTGDAYENAALPIGENQTISQPSVVAQMTEALAVDKTHKVLEIGTGSGYQTAILCELARRVFTIERFESLARRAEARLREMGYHNFVPLVGDGTLGWPGQAPFDRIIVTAASPKIPQALTDQLAPGGVLVIPVGAQGGRQHLVRCHKEADGTLQQELLGAVVFVPLVGAQGVQEKKSA
jgi:protein-L-isoaspartate(D-aspartate) O-methyltransferase